jgi:hypothetical protein
MSYFILNRPECVVGEVDNQPDTLDHLEKLLVRENTKILREQCFPGNMHKLFSVKSLIGNPNDWLSEKVLDMLVTAGVCTRTPVMHNDVHVKFLDGGLLWDYAWSDVLFSELSDEQLAQVAWDLRNHENFVHLTVVNTEPVVKKAEETLDTPQVNEYDAAVSGDEDELA